MHSERPLSPSESSSPLVLVVDDAPDHIRTVTTLLAGEACRVATSSSGSSALAAAARELPDLILLDVMMEGMDGMEVLGKLKADPETRDIPVILLTARTGVGDTVSGLEAGAADYVPKPFHSEELLARVRTQLAFKRSRDSERALIAQLRSALADVKQLSGFIPICAHCKKIRNDEGFWQQVEEYISRRSEAQFSHGLCPECIPTFFADMAEVPPQRPEAFTGSFQDVEEAWLPRVLLVDDSVSNLRTLTQGLRHDCKLLVANQGAVALELAGREQPDLILLDVVMEGMDGHETCRRLKADPRTRDIPVIFVTGKREEVDEIQGFELGAVDYITKPFSLPLVQQRIRTQLELKRYRDQLERQAMLDGLTGIPNRRRFQEFIDYVGGLAVRQGAPLSVILLDVDQFKAYNDHYGHPAGDEVLRHVARALVLTKRRTTDLVARYGGEEFVVVLPDTDAQGAGLVAEAMRASVEALAIPHAHSSTGGRLTLSLGVATWQAAAGGEPVAILKAADQALYRAKQGGRNRVSV